VTTLPLLPTFGVACHLLPDGTLTIRLLVTWVLLAPTGGSALPVASGPGTYVRNSRRSQSPGARPPVPGPAYDSAPYPPAGDRFGGGGYPGGPMSGPPRGGPPYMNGPRGGRDDAYRRQ
jgi:hypothetical protein